MQSTSTFRKQKLRRTREAARSTSATGQGYLRHSAKQIHLKVKTLLYGDQMSDDISYLTIKASHLYHRQK